MNPYYVTIAICIIVIIIMGITKSSNPTKSSQSLDWTLKLCIVNGSSKIYFFPSEGHKSIWLKDHTHIFTATNEQMFIHTIDTKTATEEDVAKAVEKAQQIVNKMKMAHELAKKDIMSDPPSGKDGYRKK